MVRPIVTGSRPSQPQDRLRRIPNIATDPVDQYGVKSSHVKTLLARDCWSVVAVSVDISEIRPGDYQDIEALMRGDLADDPAQEDAHHPMAWFPRCRSVLSLVAHDEGKVVGAIVCYDDPQQGYLHQLAIAQSHRHGDLAQALVNKALRKLNAHGSHKCRLSLPQDTEQAPFWEAVKWTDRPEWATAPMPSSAVVDRMVAGEVQMTGSGPAADPGVKPDREQV